MHPTPQPRQAKLNGRISGSSPGMWKPSASLDARVLFPFYGTETQTFRQCRCKVFIHRSWRGTSYSLAPLWPLSGRACPRSLHTAIFESSSSSHCRWHASNIHTHQQEPTKGFLSPSNDPDTSQRPFTAPMPGEGSDTPVTDSWLMPYGVFLHLGICPKLEIPLINHSLLYSVASW